MSYREVLPKVFNVGCTDPLEREFHVHEIGKGTSYNSFLIKDQKVTIVDTVKGNFARQFIDNIKSCLAGKQGEIPDDSILKEISVIFVLHTEPDHNGSLRDLYNLCPNATVVCSANCRNNLHRWFSESKDWRINILKNNESYSIGENSLQLIETPLLHWSDSTFAYMRERKLLFTSDSFGQHIGNNLTTDYDIGEEDLLVQQKVYYAQVFSQLINPTMRMCRDVEKATAGKITEPVKGAEWKTPFDTSGIAALLPAHGVCILRQSMIERSFRLYRRWAEQIPTRKVIIIYESIYDTTAKMARTIKASIEASAAAAMTGEAEPSSSSDETKPCEPKKTPLVVELMCARRSTVLDVVNEVMDAAVVCFGTATFNNAMMPNMMKLLHVIKTYRWKEKPVFCFGAYGWSKLGMIELEKYATDQLKWKLAAPMIMCVNEMDEDTTRLCKEAGTEAFKLAMEKAEAGSCFCLE